MAESKARNTDTRYSNGVSKPLHLYAVAYLGWWNDRSNVSVFGCALCYYGKVVHSSF